MPSWLIHMGFNLMCSATFTLITKVVSNMGVL